MAFSISTNQVSIANFLEKKVDENEDYIEIKKTSDENIFSWVLCDGAGGVGVFCKEWAKFLAESIPNDPSEFGKNIINWFEITSKSFHENIILKSDLSDLILNKKVYRDGSYSTMTACWFDKMANEFYYSSVGDSCIFFFEKADTGLKLRLLSSINEQDEIDSYPNLLNWNEELQNELPFYSIDVNNDFVAILTSDSLAKWILLNVALIDFPSLVALKHNPLFLSSLNNENIELKKRIIHKNHDFKILDDLLDYLKSISNNSDNFIKNIKLLHSCQEIEIDDYSLIYIEGNVSN